MKEFNMSATINSLDSKDGAGPNWVKKEHSSENEPSPCKRSNTSFHHFGYVVIFLSGLVFGAMLLLRMTIAVTMLTMVNHTSLFIMENPNASVREFFAPDYVEIGEFVWTNEIQQTIMAGYMVAYTLPQYFTTRLTMQYGVKISIPICLAICAVSNLLIPTVSYWGWYYVVALRLLNGVGASAILPSMINTIENWLPYSDIPKGIAILQFVANSVNAPTPMLSGYLASLGWKWAFYIPGTIVLGLCVAWYFLVSDKPQESKLISQRELDALNDMSESTKNGSEVEKKATQRSDLPWYFMFKIKSYYWLTICWILYCSTVGGFLFLLPSYLNRILKVSVTEIGTLNFTVQIGTMFCMLWPHPATAFLQNTFRLSITTARNILVFLTTFVVIVTFLYLSYYHDNLILVISINRFVHCTHDTMVMATVMSQFGKEGLSGLVYSMMNTFGNLSTVILCWIVGRFLDSTGQSLECWSWVLTIMAIMNASYVFVYVTCCHSKPVSVKLPAEKKDNEVEC